MNILSFFIFPSLNKAKTLDGLHNRHLMKVFRVISGFFNFQQKIAPPTNRSQVKSFLGLVAYYRDLIPHRARVLAPLSAITSTKKPFVWTHECQQSFEQIKKIVAEETILAFPDYSLPFSIYTDASSKQIGGVIM